MGFFAGLVGLLLGAGPLGGAEVAAARETLGWTAEPFVIPSEILADWRLAGEPGRAAPGAAQQSGQTTLCHRHRCCNHLATTLVAIAVGTDAGGCG